MENEIAYNNILLTLTQKLRLIDTLNKKVYQIIAKLLVSDRF